MLKQAKAARRDGRRETNTSISGRRRTKGSRAATKLTQTNKFAFDKNHSAAFAFDNQAHEHVVVFVEKELLAKLRWFQTPLFFSLGEKKKNPSEADATHANIPRVAAPPTLIFLLLLF